MFQPTELFLALRYSRTRRRGGFAAFINRVSMLGILLGVMALIVVTSVMNGFEGELKKRILGVVPHVTVTAADRETLADWQTLDSAIDWPVQVIARTPYVSAEGVIQGESSLKPVLLQGVYPEREPADSLIKNMMVQGNLADLRAGEYGIILGRSLARNLGLWPGTSVRIMAAEGQRYTPLGTLPAQRQFRVVGLFEAGSEVDQQLVFLHATDAAKLFRYEADHVTGIRLYLRDAFTAAKVAEAVRHNLQQSPLSEQKFVVDEWHSRYGRLFAAVQMEKTMMMVMLALVVAVAAFNAVSALVMLVQDKRGDMAVLQTLGLTPRRIYTVLVLQGMYTGVVGAGLGLILGMLLTLLLNPLLSLLGVNVFGYGEVLPYAFDSQQIISVLLLALGLSLLSTLYPAWRAAQVQPAETLRYE
ncbi:MAG TPA: lipoprotein-releasing ABC transporter permease subunit [Aliidiomarina sp.]|nr:lipoprotein-releasing ABC transporter permease subunit [Aliidiomarina sp.]